MSTLAALPAPAIRFDLPAGRWAHTPPERRGIPRDQVRLLVARPDGIEHVRFADLDRFLSPGDVLVVNTSATRPSALDGTHRSGPATVHLATEVGNGRWVVELRRAGGRRPLLDAAAGDLFALAAGGSVRLDAPAAVGPAGVRRLAVARAPEPDKARTGLGGVRLWHAALEVPGGDVEHHLRLHGRPISYDGGHFPISDHQTVFASSPGSAEMASAGRPFSDRLVTRLVSAGVHVVPLTLHAGVSSQEAGEPPQPEWAEVPAPTADAVNAARDRGSRVVAVGTTATRALESAVRRSRVRPMTGWTDLVITPERGTHAVDGLITGWHEADASHLLLLEAVAGPGLVRAAYAQAVAGPYLWHEFGDSCLLLP